MARKHKITIPRSSWPEYNDGVITHLEPDILEAIQVGLRKHHINKASGGDVSMANVKLRSIEINLWFEHDSTLTSLEKEMAPHSSTLAWRIPWRKSLVGYSPWGRKDSDMTEWLHFHFSLSCTGEGNGNPLQCSCLENPRDGGAWWAAILGLHRAGHNWSDLAAAFCIIVCFIFVSPFNFMITLLLYERFKA